MGSAGRWAGCARAMCALAVSRLGDVSVCNQFSLKDCRASEAGALSGVGVMSAFIWLFFMHAYKGPMHAWLRAAALESVVMRWRGTLVGTN